MQMDLSTVSFIHSTTCWHKNDVYCSQNNPNSRSTFSFSQNYSWIHLSVNWLVVNRKWICYFVYRLIISIMFHHLKFFIIIIQFFVNCVCFLIGVITRSEESAGCGCSGGTLTYFTGSCVWIYNFLKTGPFHILLTLSKCWLSVCVVHWF